VKDVNFTNDGAKFVSVGYDKNIRLWDTETGQVRLW
jgi:pre-mRNA-processing factor 17